MSLRFHGQLLVHILKGHGYLEGLPFASDSTRTPRVVTRLGECEASTRRWHVGGEMKWDERFLFHVDADGADSLTYTFHINLHGAERAIGFYTSSLATTLSQVGPHWHQVRAINFPGITDALKGELNVEVRWYPAGGPEPEPAVIAKCSAVLDSAGKTVDAGAASLPSRTARLSLSVPSGGSGSGSGHGAPGSPSPSPQPSASPSSSPRSLPKVQSLPSMSQSTASTDSATSVTPGEWTEEEKKARHRHSLFPNVATPTNHSASAAASSHFVHSSPLRGRMHADTRMFDDRNFLEHFAPASHVHEILVWPDPKYTRIMALQTVFLAQNLRIPAPSHGPPPALSPSILALHADELLLSIGGKRDDDGIRALTFVTSRQRRSFGLVDELGASSELGEDFVLQAPRGCRVVCLFGGWNARGINCLGMCYQHVESGQAGLMPVIEEERKTGNAMLGGGNDGARRGPLTKQSTSRQI